MLNNQQIHQSVLINEVIHNLNINPCGNYLDLTAGFAGHSQKILEKLTTGTLTINDVDKESINFCQKLFFKNNNVVIIHDNFANFPVHLKQLSITKFDGILMDLGVSSHQLNQPNRGFSFKNDGPIDMRMNQSNQKNTALTVLKNLTEQKLSLILKKYGDIKHPKPIAIGLKKAVQTEKNLTTTQLAKVVKECATGFEKYQSRNYLAKVFQAIRIYLNDEITNLKTALTFIPNLLKNNSRFLVIVFHSIEEKVVRNFIAKLTSFIQPEALPIKLTPAYQLITKKPILPSQKELELNPRSRSAKLFVIQKN